MLNRLRHCSIKYYVVNQICSEARILYIIRVSDVHPAIMAVSISDCT